MGKASRTKRHKFYAGEPRLSLKPATEKRLSGYVSGATAEQHDSPSRSISACWLAVGAAGLGMLAWPTPAEAKIITSNAQLNISCASFGTAAQLLDIGGNGVPQFRGYGKCFGHSDFADASGYLSAASAGAGFVNGPLKAGVRIGPGDAFTEVTGFASGFIDVNGSSSSKRVVSSFIGGSWANVSGDIGLRFLIDGQVHYGWAFLSVSVTHSSYSLSLGPIYYNSIANQPILSGETPEPGTLGLLALGALGLGFWRRKQLAST